MIEPPTLKIPADYIVLKTMCSKEAGAAQKQTQTVPIMRKLKCIAMLVQMYDNVVYANIDNYKYV